MPEIAVLFGRLRRLLKSRGRSPDDIDDLMQEAFLRLQVYCREHVVQHEEAFLVRTVLNLSAEQGRRDTRAHVCALGSDLPDIVDPAPNAEEIVAGEQALRRLERGLQRLTPRSREVLLLHRQEGLSYLQIADQLEISVSMVEKHVARAAFFLRDWMARNEP